MNKILLKQERKGVRFINITMTLLDLYVANFVGFILSEKLFFDWMVIYTSALVE